jgi:hypothetical protein
LKSPGFLLKAGAFVLFVFSMNDKVEKGRKKEAREKEPSKK